MSQLLANLDEDGFPVGFQHAYKEHVDSRNVPIHIEDAEHFWKLAVDHSKTFTLSEDELITIAEMDVCSPDRSGWGCKFDNIVYGQEVVKAVLKKMGGKP